jgi:hypothetical protein
MTIPSILRATGLAVSLFVWQASFSTACLAGERIVNTVSSPDAGKAENMAGVRLKPVTVVSDPTDASIVINGKFVHKTPVVVEIPVDANGNSLKRLEIVAQKFPAEVYEQARIFPGVGEDGKMNHVPSVLYFDLNVQRVVTVK